MTSEAPGTDLRAVADGLPPELLAGLRELAARLAREAGERLARERPEQVQVADTKSSSTDVVTAADRASEQWLRAELARERPQDRVLGEEYGAAGAAPAGADPARGPGLTWVVDPIDGTVNYLYGLPAWSVSVACVVGDPTTEGAWLPVVGAVAGPTTGELFHGARGQGAILERTSPVGPGGRVRLAVNRTTEPAQALVGTGFSYDADRRAQQGALAGRLVARVRDLRRMGSAALDLCAVAAGRLDAYYEAGTKPWDHAAGWLLVTEAGGEVLGPPGRPAGTSMLVAGGPDLARWLQDEVSSGAL